jgi:hypothetical protein
MTPSASLALPSSPSGKPDLLLVEGKIQLEKTIGGFQDRQGGSGNLRPDAVAG